jgi:serine protease Do
MTFVPLLGCVSLSLLAESPAQQGADSQQTAPDKPVAEVISEEFRRIFESSKGAVVKIHAQDQHGRLSGTGFFIDPSGSLYTAYSVAGESDDVTVELEDRKYPAQRLFADARAGIALLKVSAVTPFIPLSTRKEVEIAEPVLAIGYPMDLDATPSAGFVGGWDIRYLGRYFSTSHIRANIPVQRGQGGAPLLNIKGEVVGILVSSVDGGTGCYALPIAAAEKLHSDFSRFGEVRPGWLGVLVQPGDEFEGRGQTVVEALVPGSPASESGLAAGDILVQINDRRIRSPEDVLDASFYFSEGDHVILKVLREGQPVQINAVAGAHPTKSNYHANRMSPGNLLPFGSPSTE